MVASPEEDDMHVDDMVLVGIDDHSIEPPGLFERRNGETSKAGCRRRAEARALAEV